MPGGYETSGGAVPASTRSATGSIGSTDATPVLAYDGQTTGSVTRYTTASFAFGAYLSTSATDGSYATSVGAVSAGAGSDSG